MDIPQEKVFCFNRSSPSEYIKLFAIHYVILEKTTILLVVTLITYLHTISQFSRRHFLLLKMSTNSSVGNLNESLIHSYEFNRELTMYLFMNAVTNFFIVLFK